MASGQRMGLVGESGSGKSLTALALMRLIHPPGRVRGAVLLNGVNLMTLDDASLSKVRGGQIAMVYQDPMSAPQPRPRPIGAATRGGDPTSIAPPRREREGPAERAATLLQDVVGIQGP